MTFSKRNIAIIVGVIASLMYGLMSVFSRWMDMSFEPMTQVYLRVFGASLLGSLVFYKQINWKKYTELSLKDWLLLAMMGVGGYGLMVYAITRGALLTSLLNVSVVFSTVPFFVYLLGIIFFKRKISVGVLLLLAVSVWGVGVLASGNLLPQLSHFGAGEWWVLLATIMEAVWFIGLKLLSSKLNGREIAVVAQVIAGVALLIASFIIGEQRLTIDAFTNPWALAGLIGGVVVNLATPVMSVYMFKHLNEVFATQLFLCENIFALVIGWVFYQETWRIVHLVGAFLVLIAVYYMNKREVT